MPSDKAAYLAAHYLTASTKPPSSSSSSTKKRKRKQPASSGLLITDDDDTGWGGSNPNPDDDDDAPLTLAGTTTADFRRAKTSAWKPLGGSAPTRNPTTADAAAAAAADAILAQAATDTLALTTTQDDDPPPATLMSNGAHAGLQTASALTAQIRARQQHEAAELLALQALHQNPSNTLQPPPQQTVTHRDASTGRRLSTSHLLASARQAVADAAAAKQTAQSLLRGEVQQAQATARREALQDAALMPLARGRDDAEMNREMRAQERWNDPMAEFLAPSQQQQQKGGKRGKGRPVYKGAAAPNRYGIRPGYRWDGVDRGNGFEGERFRALNRREMGKGLEYAWQMDE